MCPSLAVPLLGWHEHRAHQSWATWSRHRSSFQLTSLLRGCTAEYGLRSLRLGRADVPLVATTLTKLAYQELNRIV
jgi:hypothetical protein